MRKVIQALTWLLKSHKISSFHQSGNALLPAVIILAGVSAVGMQAMYGDLEQNLNKTKQDMARTTGTQNNITAIKVVENLAQPAAAGAYDSSNPASFPVLFPSPYTGMNGDPPLTPVGAAKGNSQWSFSSSKITVNIPLVGRDSGEQVAQLFNANKPLSANQRSVAVTSLRAVYSTDPNQSPYVIEGYEVAADHNDGIKPNHTAALIKLPPPPAPTCNVTLDNKDATYRPSALVTGVVQVNGVALKARVPNGTDPSTGQPTLGEIITVTRKQSIDTKYAAANFQIAAPRPLPVLDGSTTTTETVSAEVVGLNNELNQCSATYQLALPPTCGLMAAKYVLARGECVKLSTWPIPQTAQVALSGDKSHLKNGMFCMDAASVDGASFKIAATASSSSGSSNCQATFITDVPGGSNGSNGGNGGNGGGKTYQTKCPFLTGTKKEDLSFFINYEGKTSYAARPFDLTNNSWFEVPVISRSQTDSWICPSTSRCYATVTQGTNRNLFVELRQADAAQCTPVPIDRITLGCFAEDTAITVGGGATRSVAELKVGDQVLNPVSGRLVAIERITIGPEALPMIVIHSDGRQLKVTTEHPMLTNRGVIMAELVEPGDRIVYADGSLHKVTSVESIAGSAGAIVRNFIVNSASDNQEDHMVVADGIVTGDLYLQTRLGAELKNKRLAAH